MEVDIRAYRPRDEKDKLAHFRAEAHITEGTAYVWIDLRYSEEGPFYCIRVDAAEPSDVGFLVETNGDGEWDTAHETDAVYEDEDGALTLGDLVRDARNFAEEHFWCDEEV